jgi:hypothetical protein
LTLARELTDPPVASLKKRRVLVLEAGSRIGGRIRTDHRSFGRPVELGAEYVHMPPLEAALWREVARYQLPLARVDKAEGYMFHPSLSEAAVPIVEATLRWNLFKALTVWKDLEIDGADMSGEEFLRADAEGTDDDVEQDFKRMIVSGHLGALEADLSMRGFASDHIAEQLKSTKEYYVQPGYDLLLDRLALGLDVRLEQKVRRIVSDGQSRWRLTCEVFRAVRGDHGVGGVPRRTDRVRTEPGLKLEDRLARHELYTKVQLSS